MLLTGDVMTEIDLEHVTGGATLKQCFATSHAAWLPGMGAGALTAYLIRHTGRSALVGTAGGFIAGVAGGCWNANHGDYP